MYMKINYLIMLMGRNTKNMAGKPGLSGTATGIETCKAISYLYCSINSNESSMA